MTHTPGKDGLIPGQDPEAVLLEGVNETNTSSTDEESIDLATDSFRGRYEEQTHLEETTNVPTEANEMIPEGFVDITDFSDEDKARLVMGLYNASNGIGIADDPFSSSFMGRNKITLEEAREIVRVTPDLNFDYLRHKPIKTCTIIEKGRTLLHTRTYNEDNSLRGYPKPIAEYIYKDVVALRTFENETADLSSEQRVIKLLEEDKADFLERHFEKLKDRTPFSPELTQQLLDADMAEIIIDHPESFALNKPIFDSLWMEPHLDSLHGILGKITGILRASSDSEFNAEYVLTKLCTKTIDIPKPVFSSHLGDLLDGFRDPLPTLIQLVLERNKGFFRNTENVTPLKKTPWFLETLFKQLPANYFEPQEVTQIFSTQKDFEVLKSFPAKVRLFDAVTTINKSLLDDLTQRVTAPSAYAAETGNIIQEAYDKRYMMSDWHLISWAFYTATLPLRAPFIGRRAFLNRQHQKMDFELASMFHIEKAGEDMELLHQLFEKDFKRILKRLWHSYFSLFGLDVILIKQTEAVEGITQALEKAPIESSVKAKCFALLKKLLVEEDE